MGIATGAIEDRYGWLTPVPRKGATAGASARGKSARERADMSASAI